MTEHENIFVRKLTFTNENKEHLLNSLTPNIPQNHSVKFYLLEIETDNPSDIIIALTEEANGSRLTIPVYLSRHRHDMIFQNNRYILKYPHELTPKTKHYKIEVLCSKEFKLEMYYLLENLDQY